MYLLGH